MIHLGRTAAEIDSLSGYGSRISSSINIGTRRIILLDDDYIMKAPIQDPPTHPSLLVVLDP